MKVSPFICLPINAAHYAPEKLGGQSAGNKSFAYHFLAIRY